MKEEEKLDTELIAVFERASKNIEDAQTKEKDNRQDCLMDRRFYSIKGAQWENELGAMLDGRPKIEINKVHRSIVRIFSEYRNNRVTVDFISKDGQDSEYLANICDGLFRSDEQDSNADEAYDNAFEEAVGGGFGAFRLRADYEDEYDNENESQRIFIEPIYDADSCVFFDPNAKKMDKSDANWVAELKGMDKFQFEVYFPKENLSSFNKLISESDKDFNSSDKIFIVEYFEKEVITTKQYTYSNMLETRKITENELDEDELQSLQENGFKPESTRKIKQCKIHKYILSGSKVIEDCGYIAGSELPIVPVYGKRWYIDGIERCMGEVRLTRDAQLLFNLQVSKLAESTALSGLEKPIFTPEQIAGHETRWANDAVRNYPYQLVNPITNTDGSETIAGAVGFTKPPQISPALQGLLQVTDASIKEIQGSDNSQDLISTQMSGEAIQKIHDRIDIQSFIYMSNFAKAIRRAGTIWLSMAKDVYIEENRSMKVVNPDKSTSSIKLLEPYKDENGKTFNRNDLADAKFNISVSVGASTSSKRQKTVNNLLEAIQVISSPDMKDLLSFAVVMNMEGEGLEDSAKYARRMLVQKGVIKPTEEELQQLQADAQQQGQPTSQDLALMAMADKDRALAIKAQADTQKVLADTQKIKAEVMDMIASMDRADRTELLNTIEKYKQHQNEMSQDIQQPMQQPQ